MPPRKGRKANATSTATQPPTIEPQQESTPEDASCQVEQYITTPQLEVESQPQVEEDDQGGDKDEGEAAEKDLNLLSFHRNAVPELQT